MKLLYISTPPFADCDFPLIKTFQEKGVDITYLIMLPPYFLKSTLFNIERQIPKTCIVPALAYKEFEPYRNYMDMSKVFIANRTAKNSLSLSFWKHNYDLYRFIRKGNYDIIHSDTILPPEQKFLFSLSKKWIQTIHDPFPHSGESSKKKSTNYQYMISHADKIVLLNKKQKDSFCSFYGVSPQKVYLNCLGVYDNIKTFIKTPCEEQKHNVLFFGRISPYKGIEYLCEAMTKVHESIPDSTLTIAGGGKMYFDITPYEKLPYVDIRNHYIDMSELAELISKCGVVACPYIDATQSGVIMTSYSLNKPVIATNVGGLGEMIDEGKTGFLVEPRNSKQLADTIIKLFKDSNLQEQVESNIDSYYNKGARSWKSIVNNYLMIYES